jgi:polyhydroxybutyrate depolymerase
MVTFLFVVATMAQSEKQLTPGDHTCTLVVDRRERSYIVHVPRGYDGSKPVPVVFVFHGGGSNAAQMAHFCGLDEKSDKEGFLIVYPNGTGRTEQLLTWNGGNCCGYAMHEKIDDVAFVAKLLDGLEKNARVDAARVYATGMSNGAILSYRLAAELSDRIAAIAPVSGPMGTESCHPKRPVPVMHFHGTDDKFAPFNGGSGERSLSQTDFYSVKHSLDCWIKANECRADPIVKEERPAVEDGTRITRKTWEHGKNGAEVVLIEIAGGGHTWAGRKPPLLYLGKSTKNIDANDEIWEFFKKHPRK